MVVLFKSTWPIWRYKGCLLWLESGGGGRHGGVVACPYPAVAVAPSPDVPSRLCRLGGVWWGRGRKVSALLGMSLDWHVSSLLPLYGAGGGGIDTPPGRSYSCEACNSRRVSCRWRREARTPPMPVMPVARASRMPCPPAWGSTPAGRYVYLKEVSGVWGAPPSV